MVADHDSQAVFAGLVTAASLWAMPTCALAAPADGASVMWGGAGTVAGLVVGAGAMALWSRRQRRIDHEEFEARIRALEAQVQGTSVVPAAKGKHLANGTPRYSIRHNDAPAADTAADAPVTVAEKPRDAPGADYRPLSSVEVRAMVDAMVDDETERALEQGRPHGRHFKGAVAAQDAPKGPDAPAVADKDAPAARPTAAASPHAPAAPRAAVVPAAPSSPDAAAAAPSRATLAGRIPSIEATGSAASPSLGGTMGLHTAITVDYESVASDYVERKTFKSRMIALSKGVAMVLSERLGADVMDDMPMIQRADGTVADIGTSWWEAAAAKNDLEISRDLGPELRSVEATVDDFKEALVAGATGAVATAPSSTAPAPAPVDVKEPRTSHGPSPLEVRVPSMEEPTGAMELMGRGDGWEAALEAMDHRFDDNLVTGKSEPGAAISVDVDPVPTPSRFKDLIGGTDTLDEPDGLEPDTLILTFRPPAGHPEVTDTASYINYLVANELEGNSSKTARKAARSSLKVIQGGSTGNLQVV